jgi:predicted transcriptional regulator
MACINADGSLTKTAENIMLALETPLSDVEIAEKIGFPVFTVRGSLRQLVSQGYIDEADGQYTRTDFGQAKLQA